jgi:hypothetical protein
LVPPEKRQKLAEELDKAIDNRAVTKQEAGRFNDPKDPAYKALVSEKSAKFGKEIEKILTSYVPDIEDYL